MNKPVMFVVMASISGTVWHLYDQSIFDFRADAEARIKDLMDDHPEYHYRLGRIELV